MDEHTPSEGVLNKETPPRWVRDLRRIAKADKLVAGHFFHLGNDVIKTIGHWQVRLKE